MINETQQNTVTKRVRVVGLDGFRGALAIFIVLAHTGSHWSPAMLHATGLELTAQAVVSFFVLSGFLIYWPFARAIIDGRSMRDKLGDYALSRLLRVFPGATTAFAIAWATGTLYLTNAYVAETVGDSGEAIGRFDDPWRVFLHLSLQQTYLPSELQTGIAPQWTLTVELAYYLALPLVAALCVAVAARLLPRVQRYVVAAVPAVFFIVMGLASRAAGAVWQQASGMETGPSEWGPNALAVFTRSLPASADAFGWGMLAIVVWLAVERGVISPRGRRIARLVGWISLAVGLVVVVPVAYLAVPRFMGAGVSLASAGAILLLALPIDDHATTWRVSLWMDNPVTLWLGKTSLSIYLLHVPIILMLERLGVNFSDDILGLVLGWAVVMTLSVAAASLVFTLVEQPALRLKGLIRTKR